MGRPKFPIRGPAPPAAAESRRVRCGSEADNRASRVVVVGINSRPGSARDEVGLRDESIETRQPINRSDGYRRNNIKRRLRSFNIHRHAQIGRVCVSVRARFTYIRVHIY